MPPRVRSPDTTHWLPPSPPPPPPPLPPIPTADDPADALSMFQPGPDWDGPPMAVLLNKADLVPPERLAELEAWYKEHCR